LGLAGRRRFEEHYSWDVIIAKHYRPLLGTRRSAAVRNADTPASRLDTNPPRQRGTALGCL
jgi:hypothetical protein